jgi:ABC transporter, ATP-binding protein
MKSSSQTAEELEIKEERKLSYQEQKELNKKITKLKRDIVRLENEMEKITLKREGLNREYEIAGKQNDVGKLMEIQEHLDKIELEEMEKMEEWDKKSEELKNYGE